MVQRLHGTLAAKPVKRPEEQAVELTPRCRGEQLLELVTTSVLAAGPVLVLVNKQSSPGVAANDRSWRSCFSVSCLPTPFEDTLAYVATRIIAFSCAENER